MPAVRVYPCLCVDDVERSIEFYRALLAVDVAVDVGWYVEVVSNGDRSAVVAFVERGHATVPACVDATRGGVLVSAIVDDATAAYVRARAIPAHVVQELRDEEFGQRHFMVSDPDGFVVDVIEPIAASLAFRRQLVAGLRRWR